MAPFIFCFLPSIHFSAISWPPQKTNFPIDCPLHWNFYSRTWNHPAVRFLEQQLNLQKPSHAHEISGQRGVLPHPLLLKERVISMWIKKGGKFTSRSIFFNQRISHFDRWWHKEIIHSTKAILVEGTRETSPPPHRFSNYPTGSKCPIFCHSMNILFGWGKHLL